jgi:nitrite reductase/ring-hydroxylating ferredoxin subunit
MSEPTNGGQTVPPDGRPWAEQPAWRRDFPIDWPEDHYVSRRDFTKFLGLTSLAFVIGQLWIGLKSWLGRRPGRPAERAIARLAGAGAGGAHAGLPELPPGKALVFRYPGEHDPCLLLRPASGPPLAFGQKCTHLSCAVVPELEEGRLACPCHKGFFDLATGRPTAGPPRRPLPRVTLETRDGVVYATGVEGTP